MMTLPDQSATARHRYEATIRVTLAADALDEAYRMQQQIAEIVRDRTNERVTNVTASMLDLQLAFDEDRDA